MSNAAYNLLLTGATGFVGTALTKRLIEDGKCNLVCAVRKKHEGLFKDAESVLVGSMRADTDWSAALSGIDVVIHTAARVHVMVDTASDPCAEYNEINYEGTMNLAKQAVEEGVKRFIFLSSIKVNGEGTKPGAPFTAEDEPQPKDPYGLSKSKTESSLLRLAAESGLEVVIIRPVLVYGPGVKGNLLSMMRWLDKGIPLPLGGIQNKRSLVALDNLVDLVVTCIEHPAAANHIFLVSDGEDLSTTELLEKVAKALGKPARLIPVPSGFIKIVAQLTGRQGISQRLLGSLQVDISKTRQLLGWRPPIGIDEGLEQTVRAFRQQQ